MTGLRKQSKGLRKYFNCEGGGGGIGGDTYPVPFYFIADDAQTEFVIDVTPAADVAVYRNGIRLSPEAYEQTGNLITLFDPCEEEDEVTIIANEPRDVGTVAAANVMGLAALLANKAEKTSVVTITDAAFGAIGDGVTPCNAAVNAALTFVHTMLSGGIVYVPPGTFRWDDTGPALVMYSNTELAGAGDCSVIQQDDRPTNPRKDMILMFDVEDVAIRNIRLRSTLDLYTNETAMSHIATGINVKRLRVENVTFQNVRFCALAVQHVEDALITGCRFEDSQRDACRVIHARNVRIVANHFLRVADDAISLHSSDVDTNIVGHGFVVSDNTFEACQGPKILGAKALIFTGNILIRCIRHPLLVSSELETVEGNTPVFAITIADNIILDTFADRGTSYAIMVQIRNRSKGALSAQPGAVAPVWPYAYENDVDSAGKVNVGGFGITIRNNQIGWTLARGVNYEDYGFGPMLDRPGSPTAGYINPAITDASYACAGIIIDGPVRGVHVSDNILFGGSLNPSAMTPAIWMTSDSASANTIVAEDVLIERNIITDWIGQRGIMLDHVTANGSRNVIVARNKLNLDPFFRHPDHNNDNTWDTPDTLIGIDFASRLYNGTVEANHFKNLSRPHPAGEQAMFLNNVVYFQPNGGDGLGDEPNNRGVRYVPEVPQYLCVIIDGDPASVSFGATVTIPARSASSMPTNGTYIKGHQVRNASPVVLGTAGSRYIVNGWVRLITGSAHVANTDWAELRCLTGA